MANDRRVTLAEVAKRAGLSPTTASFVLSGRSDEMGISKAARQRIFAAAESLGYRPNLAAQTLRTKSSKTVGLVSDIIATEPFAGDVVRGAVTAARDAGHFLVLGETELDPEIEASLLLGMRDRHIDRLLYGTMSTREVILPAALTDRTVVLLNCLSPGPLTCVVPNEYEAGRTAARELLRDGHRDSIVVVGQRFRHVYAARERMRGIRSVLHSAGAIIADAIDCDWAPSPAYSAVRHWLRRGGSATALLCMNDRVAMGAYQALGDVGALIPQDISVISFDDSDLASWLRPSLTSVAIPHYELGYIATQLLIAGPTGERVVRQVEMPLSRRASTGPVTTEPIQPYPRRDRPS